MHKFSTVDLVGCCLVAFILGAIAGGLIESSRNKDLLIEAGIAEYHPKTGKWQLLEEFREAE